LRPGKGEKSRPPAYDATAVTPITFAHRGARAQHPDNTLPAFHYALEHGASGLETDAWISRDGQVVLVHDDVVRTGRLARRLVVRESTAAQLLDAGVPSLTDLYDAEGRDFDLSVDLKDVAVDEPIVATARQAGDPERTWLCVPELERLLAIRETASDIRLVHSTRRSRLPDSMERHAADLAAAGIDAMNLHHAEWTAGLVALFHRFDIRAFAWDAQEVRHLEKMKRFGIDAVYSDHVDRLVQVFGAKE
jgi:glycerophosphoryl diester phosphodiesterase